MAPKEASPRGWWNEVRKVFHEHELPAWYSGKLPVKFFADFDTIHFSWPGHDVFIARRRDMR
jgi:hypothetical protein